ncbi:MULTISPECIES: alpha/beta fold hydrolase [unclassified Flavobacterium]|uniref:alpha/beta fold hydrolase n=1 Tax=unclassified Flavobacterium TaxID=196869 RepID=UPI001F14050E|nr:MULTISPECIES: alpha/beta hydrolase [unclassified Flavobacterium]UMY65292.1 alpha/beta hydrolase [Flavobacterium sp. HJ-32-4]
MKSLLLSFLVCWLLAPGLVQAQNTPNSFVSVDNRKMAYKVVGLENRKAGQPIIVFESGLGMGGGNFEPVFAHLPKDACYVVYDRNGLGESEADDRLKTDTDVVEKLHRMLQQLHLKAPYLLVGHSLGGPFIRLFASRYPQEVAGMVFIDPTDFMLTPEQNETARQKAESAIGYRELWPKMLTEMSADANMPEGVRMETKRELSGSTPSFFHEYQNLAPLPDIPVAVLIAYNRRIEKFEEETSIRWGIKLRPWMDAFDNVRIENYSGMIQKNRNSFVLLLPEYSHGIHNQDPELVAAMIGRVLRNGGIEELRN